MNIDIPKNISEYRIWLKEKHDFEVDEKEETYYDSVTNKIRSAFEKSDLWLTFTNSLQTYNDKYLLDTGYHLLSDFNTKINIKPFDSFLLKTYRMNILQNTNWPKEPNDGWILPTNWFLKIKDVIRTLLVVKYLDGVVFLLNKTRSLCEEKNSNCAIQLEAKEEGYYAAHLYTKQTFEIPTKTWDTEKIDVNIEIQITTQLQEVIRRMLHKYYEAKRKKIEKEEVKWQWNYTSDEFSANYLGHILHYIEGMIMEIREKQKRGKTA